MSDLIHLLPNHIANQIAAGEVIQRPSSAVKELLENAVDAGASEIYLHIVDAGKAMIQVIDNGKGMNETDARNCFERHATSKINEIEDLFKIRTMGFRGEALASIASVAQVTMRTKREGDELGTEIEIENSQVIKQGPCACEEGTSFTMKNLFFNVPARRNFLKGNVVELKNIIEEFTRVALSFPDIFFSYTINGQEVFHLEKRNLKQRIVQLMGNNLLSKLVPIEESTDYLHISGFIGKPDTAKKTRGDQYLFVNNRFIKNNYLTHAVFGAFDSMIPEKSYPFFAIFIDLDPTQIDINVHPTKQEIKFEDEKLIYTFLKSAVKMALAQFSISPTIDFDLDPSIQNLDVVAKPLSSMKEGEAMGGGLYKSFVDRHQAHRIETGSNLSNWRDFFETNKSQPTVRQADIGEGSDHTFSIPKSSSALVPSDYNGVSQFHQTYILFEQPNGITMVHQQLAHQQILFEKFNKIWVGKGMVVQQNLFPVAINLSPADTQVLTSILPDLLHLGYLIEPFGINTFLLQGSPNEHPTENDLAVIEMIIEDVKDATANLHQAYKERIARTMARKHAVKTGVKLTHDEMRLIVEQLIDCKQSNTHFDGKPTFIEVKRDYLSNVFGV